MQHKPKVGEVISIEEDEYLAPVNEVDDNKMDYEQFASKSDTLEFKELSE